MRKSLLFSILLLIISTLLFYSCDLNSSDSDDQSEEYILSGFYWLAGDDTALTEEGASRSSINTTTMNTTNVFANLVAAGSYANFESNYPEQGQKTFFTVTVEESNVSTYIYNDTTTITGAAVTVYRIATKTTFPAKENLFTNYLEEYFVLDIDTQTVPGTSDFYASDGIWTNDDPVVTKNSDGTWKVDSKARESMQLEYQDDSSRYEWITADSNDGTYYAHFTEDGVTEIPSSSWTPATGTGMDWSSKVYYYQHVNNWIDFWYRENKEVFGVRYYAESTISGKLYRTSLSFERFVSKGTLSTVTADNCQDLVEGILFGDLDSGTENLAEVVIWNEISSNNKKRIVTYTKVNPTFGDTFNINTAIEYAIGE